MIKNIVTVVVGLIVFFFVVSLFGSSETPAPKQANEVTQEELYKNTFVQACVSEAPGQRSYCECVWNDLRAKYSLKDIDEISKRYEQSGNLPISLQNSISNCIGSVKGLENETTTTL